MNHQQLYQALIDRDPAFEGRVFVGVTSTGIFCRLTCPARKPLPEHCRFFQTRNDCLQAGFRPCKRCRPMGPAADNEPLVRRLMQALETEPERRWSERNLIDLGFDPSTVRRCFKRHFGMTFLQMARRERIAQGFRSLSQGKRVIEAQQEAGFDSPAAFRSAFAKLLGQPPKVFTKHGHLRADWLATPLGAMIAVSDPQALHLLEFVERRALAGEIRRLYQRFDGSLGIGRWPVTDQLEEELAAYFAGRSAQFSVPLALQGSPFTLEVWSTLRQIPAGETRSYSDIARLLARPNATRAVARANGANQIALVVPCHRVIASDGSLTGYGGGLWRKQKLIELEQQYTSSNAGGSHD